MASDPACTWAAENPRGSLDLNTHYTRSQQLLRLPIDELISCSSPGADLPMDAGGWERGDLHPLENALAVLWKQGGCLT